MFERIAIHLRCRRKNERSIFVLGQTQRVVCAERANFQCGDRQFEIIDWTGGGSEMKDVVDFLVRQKNKIRDIMFNELEILIPGQVPDVGSITRDQIVDGNDPMTFSEQSITQV